MLGGVGDRLTGDGWPVDWSDMAPVGQYGAFGGVGANFFAAKTPKRRQKAVVWSACSIRAFLKDRTTSLGSISH